MSYQLTSSASSDKWGHHRISLLWCVYWASVFSTPWSAHC